MYALYGGAGVGKTRLVGQAPVVYGKTLYINCLGGPQSIIDRAALRASGLLVEAEVASVADLQKDVTAAYCDQNGFAAVVVDRYDALIVENVLAKLQGASDTRAVYGDNLRVAMRGLAHLQLLRRPVFLLLGERFHADETGAMWYTPSLPGQLAEKFTDYASLLARITVKEDTKSGTSIRRVQVQPAGNRVEARTREPSGKVPALYEANDLALADVMRAAGFPIPERTVA